MKLLKPFLILALICCIHARKVEYESHIDDESALNEINFEDLINEAKFHVTIDENDTSIAQSTGIWDQVQDEIEAVNDGAENLNEQMNEIQSESDRSGWRPALKDSIIGLYNTISSSVANVIDSAINKASDKFDQGISGALNLTDRVHAQKKLLIAKVQKCAEQQGLSADTISEDAYAKIEHCIPDAVNSINETAQTIIGNIKEARSFITSVPTSMNECLNTMREASSWAQITASAKTVWCLTGLSASTCTEAAQFSMKMATCGTKCVVRFEQIKLELKKCYMTGFYAITKEAADKGIDLGQCVLGGEKKNKPE
ncbi:uncharacterized protein LOC123305940 [Chrysoperla carnea]|uniref:uncharacterized protein LOC123305940 n=1 Tax=Chrysoperla carnea TaxID=189513 RepID=UPI001D05E0FA|nr:uncharacterized protein LOC123305940 [Chrysoperla carnea]